MEYNDYIQLLKQVDIRPTSTRILVFKTISRMKNTFSMHDVEHLLPDMDKSSIFRALTLFHEHQLIHSIDDGSGSLKYCVCSNLGFCGEKTEHCHFYCEQCKKTFCLENDSIPVIPLSDDFVINSINYVIKGICPPCVKHSDAADKKIR